MLQRENEINMLSGEDSKTCAKLLEFWMPILDAHPGCPLDARSVLNLKNRLGMKLLGLEFLEFYILQNHHMLVGKAQG